MIQPISKPAPVRERDKEAKQVGIVYDDATLVFVHERVLEEILDYSEQDATRELGGFLVGGVYVDSREYVEIAHYVPAVDVKSRAASLTFTHETWAAMTREVQRRYPEDMVVGWHHTHPNFGVFLSGYDLFVHKNFFSEPWQVAMVVDPQRTEFGFFQWRCGEIVDCGFVCVRDGGHGAAEPAECPGDKVD